MLKALNAKKRYEALQENCGPETFLDRAYEAAEALKMVAKEISPKSNSELLAATFTLKGTTLKSYSIPRPKCRAQRGHHQRCPGITPIFLDLDTRTPSPLAVPMRLR